VPGSASHRVLVVDDEGPIRDLLVDFLESQGYVVEGAASATAGGAAARERSPDVVLLDLVMPGGASGLDVVSALARERPVIVISGTHDWDLARTALERGAFDFVTKPFDLARVAMVVAAALCKR
jgi:two-component system nitrogen regulation response regulator GlnG